MPESLNESALLNYLRKAEKRPGMYFGSCSVDHVRQHLDGWRAHRRVHLDEDAFADFFFESFHSFVEAHYHDNRTVGWSGLIRENTETDEDGFRTFMSLLEQFAMTCASERN
ncbi:MAG: hypothetical protein JXR14_09915 [Paracoccaceae bacterium]